jgi:formylglycine-generating enzyme required for sulfatase activity
MMSKVFTYLYVASGLVATVSAAGPDQRPRVWQNPKDGMTFVWIHKGTFMAEVPGNTPEAKPQGMQVSFADGFWMAHTEATVGQFRSFVKQTGYVTDAERATNRWTWKNPGFKQRRNHPVVYLTSNDAMAYARWAGVDLPTDAEWLYACRAGTTNRYYWGDELNDQFLWHRGNAADGTRPVASKKPNAWGLSDMVGNAWEYCKVADCKPGHQCFAQMGSAWTRCPRYRTRQGFVADNLIAEGSQLHKCDPNPKFPPYPWDDDRGFRCIKRTIP